MVEVREIKFVVFDKRTGLSALVGKIFKFA